MLRPLLRCGLPVLFALLGGPAAAQRADLDRVQLPPGFRMERLASVPGARSLALGERGTLFVGSRSGRSIHAITPEGRVFPIGEGLSMPNGVAFRDGALYVGEVSRILRFDRIEDRLDAPGKPVVVFDKLPRETHHGWKFIRFGPDGRLYIPIGAPCNVCNREGYALLGALDLRTLAYDVFARGIRNTVGFDWHPGTRELWFTDNGRDWLGDDLPGDELNHAPRAGMHFGFPHCHQGDLPDPEFGAAAPCSAFQAPARKLGAHVAALGMRFYTGTQFPPAYRNQLFVAEHGSWNRSRKVGYRIMLARLEGSRVVAYEPFAQGWLEGENVTGRPVDVEVLPDGSLAVSDDFSGAVYRIRYVGGSK